MIKGLFIKNTPFIPIVLSWEKATMTSHAILDTGFTGDLQITKQEAQELGLRVSGVTRVEIANGDIVEVPVSLVLGSMEGKQFYLQVLIAGIPLAGISFLTKFSYKAIVDCKNKKVSLRRM